MGRTPNPCSPYFNAPSLPRQNVLWQKQHAKSSSFVTFVESQTFRLPHYFYRRMLFLTQLGSPASELGQSLCRVYALLGASWSFGSHACSFVRSTVKLPLTAQSSTAVSLTHWHWIWIPCMLCHSLQNTQFLDQGQIKAIGTSGAPEDGNDGICGICQNCTRPTIELCSVGVYSRERRHSVFHNYGIRRSLVQSTCPRDGHCPSWLM